MTTCRNMEDAVARRCRHHLLIGIEARLVEERGEGGRTPLIHAAIHNNVPFVEALLAGGADVNATDDSGLTALHHASTRGHRRCVEALLRPPPDPLRAFLPRDDDANCSDVAVERDGRKEGNDKHPPNRSHSHNHSHKHKSKNKKDKDTTEGDKEEEGEESNQGWSKEIGEFLAEKNLVALLPALQAQRVTRVVDVVGFNTRDLIGEFRLTYREARSLFFALYPSGHMY